MTVHEGVCFLSGHICDDEKEHLLSGCIPGEVVTHVLGVDEYEGVTEVVPKAEEQILSTSGKYLKEDIVIQKIPYLEVINISGGKTAVIGG